MASALPEFLTIMFRRKSCPGSTGFGLIFATNTSSAVPPVSACANSPLQRPKKTAINAARKYDLFPCMLSHPIIHICFPYLRSADFIVPIFGTP
ncbi:Uncharacterised protein [uncultured archaeon]|nr:Uncharacterised protein [uncultured archaeon]